MNDSIQKHPQARAEGIVTRSNVDLNAADILEGYFSGGTSTYKPNNTLTRGQVSAIVFIAGTGQPATTVTAELPF